MNQDGKNEKKIEMPSSSRHHNVSLGAAGLPADSDTEYDGCDDDWQEIVDNTLALCLKDMDIDGELKDVTFSLPQYFYLGDDEGEVTSSNSPSMSQSIMEIDQTIDMDTSEVALQIDHVAVVATDEVQCEMTDAILDFQQILIGILSTALDFAVQQQQQDQFEEAWFDVDAMMWFEVFDLFLNSANDRHTHTEYLEDLTHLDIFIISHAIIIIQDSILDDNDDMRNDNTGLLDLSQNQNELHQFHADFRQVIPKDDS